jgi:ribosomal-protein-alanine N-acetyltransferase
MTSDGSRFRPMTAADLSEVVRIEQACFDSPWSREQFLAAVGGDGVLVEPVLECAPPGEPSRIAGYASAWVIAGEMQINNLAIAPVFRRQGLGGLVLQHLMAEAVRLGCSEVTLEVAPSNRPAVRLYEGAGFKKAGIRRGYYRKSGEDALILTRRIGIPL